MAARAAAASTLPAPQRGFQVVPVKASMAADSRRMVLIWAGVRSPFFSSIRATTPVVKGVAMLVPWDTQ